jgi:hypothetical protein
LWLAIREKDQRKLWCRTEEKRDPMRGGERRKKRDPVWFDA